ncbi:hypothetical protein [Herpetosiphon sp. NSE202]|uniref:hypothetical protein n=1 Tax=Herpetosiphon sp. NSE202 TaxID=3351349 RepID=UPI00363A5FD6
MIKHWMRPMLAGLLLLLASCGQPDRSPTKIQPLAPIANSGAQPAQPTATYEDPFAWVIGTPPADAIARVTAEAAHDLAIIHFEETMQSLPTADPMGPPKTYESLPTRVLPTGIVYGDDCESAEGDPSFITMSCWMTRIHNETIRIRVSAGQEFYEAPGSIRVSVYPEADFMERDMQIYPAPQATNLLNIMAVNYPMVELESDNGLPFRFNLETRQWLDAAGIAINPTGTDPYASIIPTLTPPGGISVASWSLLDGNTGDSIGVFDPLASWVPFDFGALSTDNFNLKAITQPLVVGSVQFMLNGKPYRIDNDFPYTLIEKNSRWHPELGDYQLQMTAYSGPNATGTQGGSFMLQFTVSGFPITPISYITVTPTH